MANLNPNMAGLKHWPKGVSPNPGGKPKAASERDWVIARRHTQEAIDKILEFMRGKVRGYITNEAGVVEPREYAAPPTLQLSAAQMLLERGWGRPPQALHVTDEREGLKEVSELEALEFIRSRIASIAARLEEDKHPIIDHQGNGESPPV